jgi:cytochrome c-type biogenesis protein CcmH
MLPGAKAAYAAWTVSGTVTLAPAVAYEKGANDVLFVTARVPGRRMPVAVARLPAPSFPQRYELRAGHATNDAGGMPIELEIAARLSRSGLAGPVQPGDLEGAREGKVAPGADGIDIVIAPGR